MKQGIIESISVRHVGRLLEEAELKPHQSRYWLTPPPDEEFDAKVYARILLAETPINSFLEFHLICEPTSATPKSHTFFKKIPSLWN